MKKQTTHPVFENIRGPRAEEDGAGHASVLSEDFARVLANASCNRAVFLSDERDHIVFWSAGAERLLGYSPAEAHGRTLQSLAGETILSASTFGHASLVSSPIPPVSTWLRHKNGARFWCWLSSEADKTKDGETIFVNFLTDVTLQKHHEENLRIANDTKERLLANVSHELRTPLSAILLWSQLFEEQSVIDPGQLKEGLEVIRRSAMEQRELIEDLIDMIRINHGKLRLDPAPTDLGWETCAGLEAARLAAREKGIFLKETIEPDLGVVLVDPTRWKQIIWNLLSNAVKFTSPAGRVEFSVSRENDLIVIRVSDTGIGIAPEFLPSIFERFGQAANSTKRAHSGLGLGLGITRELVRLQSGTITAESRGIGHGATFTVSLPLPLIMSSLGRPAPKMGISGSLDSLRILLVEDCSETRAALTAVLEEAGARVIATSGASAALYEFRANPPDILISDLGLPHVDGNDLITKIRSMEKMLRRSPVPALVLTAHAGDENAQRALKSGFSRHLAKPAAPSELIDAVLKIRAPH